MFSEGSSLVSQRWRQVFLSSGTPNWEYLSMTDRMGNHWRPTFWLLCSDPDCVFFSPLKPSLSKWFVDCCVFSKFHSAFDFTVLSSRWQCHKPAKSSGLWARDVIFQLGTGLPKHIFVIQLWSYLLVLKPLWGHDQAWEMKLCTSRTLFDNYFFSPSWAFWYNDRNQETDPFTETIPLNSRDSSSSPIHWPLLIPWVDSIKVWKLKAGGKEEKGRNGLSTLKI